MNEVAGYLSQFTIDQVIALKNKLTNPYQWHQKIWTLFPEKVARDFLFHIDASKDPLKVLILSKMTPLAMPLFQVHSKPLYTSYFSAERYRFEIYCNPTQKKCVRLEDGTRKKNGMRLGILNAEKAEEWLRNKGALGGFQIESLEEVNYDLLKFDKGPNMITLAAVTFRGTLAVTEKQKFMDTIFNGLGSAKGLGFGLLKIIPIQE